MNTSGNKPREKIIIDHGECLVCGACVGICPVNAMSLDSAILRIQYDICTLCDRCLVICPVGALSRKELPA